MITIELYKEDINFILTLIYQHIREYRLFNHKLSSQSRYEIINNAEKIYKHLQSCIENNK